jgi:hypothetical protein
MSVAVLDFELAHTEIDARGKCGFCGKEENGYAKRTASGEWRASCWNCIRPNPADIPPMQSRRKVGTVHEEPVEDAPEEPVRKRRKIDAAEAIALYAEGRGQKVTDIAAHFGYPEGEGYSAIRAVLVKAGVYKKYLQ